MFNYHIIKNDYYFAFNKINDIFIATKEKAFIDCLYLFINNKYKFDLNSIDFNKLDMKIIKGILKEYPGRISKKAGEICRI